MILPQELNRWPIEWREAYEERAGIIEYMALVPRDVAERLAAREVREFAARIGEA
jgi:hypothetical protein